MTRQDIVTEVARCWSVLARTYGHDLGAPPRAEISTRMTTTAGVAYPSRRLIKFASCMIHEPTFSDTVGHEVAHVWVDCYFRRPCGHGPLWRQAMRVLGLEPQRCHNYASAQRRRRGCTYSVQCNCRTIEFGAVRYNRLRAGKKYRCTLCGGQIREA